VGKNVFQKMDSAAPNIVFVRNPEGVFLYTATGANRKLPLWEIAAKLAGGAAFAFAAALSALYMLLWIPSAFMGRLAERGGVTIRLLPWLAVVSVLGLAGTTLFAISANDLELVGKPSPLAWSIYGLSLAVPALGTLSLLRTAMGAADANIAVRALAWISSLSVVAFAGYMWSYGWIGMKLWE
jgi:hypothetical protein